MDIQDEDFELEADLQEAVSNALRELCNAHDARAREMLFKFAKESYLAARRPCWCGTCMQCLRAHRESLAAKGYSEADIESALGDVVAHIVQQRRAAVSEVGSGPAASVGK